MSSLVLAEGLHEAQGMESIAAKVAEAMSTPIEYNQQPLEVSLSIGGVMTRNPDMDRDQLLHAADQAMYCSKSEGGGQFIFKGVI